MQPRALRLLLTLNVAFYVAWLLVLHHLDPAARFVYDHLGLHPGLPDILFQPWQLITYNFLHLDTSFRGFLHILFNMLWLVWIGREYEQLHGAPALMAVYLLGGLGGGLLTVLLHNLFPAMPYFDGMVYGASASVLGLMTLVGVRYPYQSVALLFIGTVRLIYVVIGFLVIDLLFMAGGGTSVSAHLGGALFGFLMASGEQRGLDLSSWARFFFPERASPRRSAARQEAARPLEAWFGGTRRQEPSDAPVARIYPMPSRERVETEMEREVDRLLDKISEQGYEALTEEEKRILQEASQK